MDETINYINQKLNGRCEADTKKKELVIRIYDKGELVREDKAYFTELNADDIYYSDEEKSLIIKCYEKDCVYRKIFSEDIKRFYSRINIPFETDSTSTSGVTKAFKHLIRTVQDDRYQSMEPFE